MKRIIYLITILGTILVSCNPLDDINSSLDKEDKGVVGNTEYTLTDDDYTDAVAKGGLGLSYTSLNSEDDAKELLPAFLTYHYPYLGEGSSIIVGYNLYVGSAEGVSDYTSAEEYEVADVDYYDVATEVGDAGFFNNTYKAEDYIPGILDANIASPEEGKKVAVSYDYASIDYGDISGTVIYQEDFQSYVVPDLGTLQTFSITGAQVWKSYSSSSGYQAGLMSGYSGGNQENEDWLVLPQIDLTGFSNAELKLSQVLNFLATGVIGTDIAVKVSIDYDGLDPTTATWTNLDFDQWPAGSNYDIVESKASLADYADETITIAFYYKSTIDYAPNWRLVSIVVEEGEAIKTDKINVFYEYSSSSWKPAGSEVYYLSSADYNSMGTGSGQPGQYDNFSSSIPADDYITKFLSITSPYAYGQDDDEVIVIYKYYSSSCSCTQTRGNLYTVVEGAWTAHESTIATTLQFGVEDGAWVPDNTIRYTLTSADYEYLGTALVGDTNVSGGLSTLTNYHDYDSSWSQSDINYSLGVLLDSIDPSAAEGQKYLMSYLVYSGGIAEFSVLLIKEGGEWIPK